MRNGRDAGELDRSEGMGANAPVLVLLNPSARVAAGGGADVATIERHLRAVGLACTIVRTATEAEACWRARQAARAGGWRAVVAAGGDGTVHAVAEGLVRGQTERASNGATSQPEPGHVALGILPLGTMNNIAHSLGVPEDLRLACAVLARAQARPLDVGLIGERLFLEVATAGLEATLTPVGNKVKGRLLARPRLLLDALAGARKFRPRRVLLEVDGRQIRARTLQVTVCNAPRYGMSFEMAPGARMDDGWLDVVYGERQSLWLLARHYLSVMGGRRGNEPRVHVLRARRIRIEPEGVSWPVHADGDDVGRTPMTAVVVPGALRVVAPPAGAAARADAGAMGPMEVMLRAAASPSTALAAQAALAAATRAGESLAASTEGAWQALGATTDEARRAVGVEPAVRSARRASLLRVVYLVALVWATASALAVRRMNLLPGDLQLTRALQRHRSPLLDGFWRAVAAPGFPRLSTPLVGATVAAFLALRLRVEATFLVLASGTNLVNWLLKRVVRRQRPTHDLVHVARVINEPGFPSGHVMHYLSFYGFLAAAALANLRPSRLRASLVAVCAAMIGLVGPSRVYLGAHWPSDVAAGYLIGGVYLGGVLEAYARVKERETSQVIRGGVRLRTTELRAGLRIRRQRTGRDGAGASGAEG